MLAMACGIDFSAQNYISFQLVQLSYNAKVKMQRLGLFKNVVIAIDVSKGE